ncbi:hypothetical protein BT96DRAFT_950631 [Gymnopus androsaceus JB14]|uniref:Uncharacterized protein n=1 Tax=Gymnopus androsaceus JB14 TaxID=1447944 RepID=A0A6A4GFK9_9AGAR|nr:hypothetical protein BT96DRAFT_950631 [Gymnopus androsaceus JB14]
MSARRLRSQMKQMEEEGVAAAPARRVNAGASLWDTLLYYPDPDANGSDVFVPVAGTRAAAAAELAAKLVNKGKGKARAAEPHCLPLGPLPNGMVIVSPARPAKASSSRIPPPPLTIRSPTISNQSQSPAFSIPTGNAAQSFGPAYTATPWSGIGSLQSRSLTSAIRGSGASSSREQSQSRTAGSGNPYPESTRLSTGSSNRGFPFMGPMRSRSATPSALASPFPGPTPSQRGSLAVTPHYSRMLTPAMGQEAVSIRQPPSSIMSQGDFQSNRGFTPNHFPEDITCNCLLRPDRLGHLSFRAPSRSATPRIHYPPPAGAQQFAYLQPMLHPQYGVALPVYMNAQLVAQNFTAPLLSFIPPQAQQNMQFAGMNAEEDDGSDFPDPRSAVVPSIATPYSIKTGLNSAVITCLRKGWHE